MMKLGFCMQGPGIRAGRPQAPEDVGLRQSRVALGGTHEVIMQWARKGLESDRPAPGTTKS